LLRRFGADFETKPIMRRLLTRLLAIIPSMVVAIAVGRSGIDTLLVASQVVLSIVLPFITFPLLYCTAKKSIMSVRRPKTGTSAIAADSTQVEDANAYEMVDYSSNKIAIAIGAVIWLVIVAANVYAIIELAIGI